MFILAAGLYYATQNDLDFCCYVNKTSDIYNFFMTCVRPYTCFKNFKLFQDNSFTKEYRLIWDDEDYSTQFKPIRSIPSDKDGVLVTGYRQNPRYFTRQFAWNLYKPQRSLVEKILSLYSDVDFNSVVSIHARRGDYYIARKFGFVMNERDFYDKAFEMFPSDQKYIVISDDINWCREVFKGDQFVFADREDPSGEWPKMYIDMYMMTLCQHNIISNSSFSWWAAYLNQTPQRKVIYNDPWYTTVGTEKSKFTIKQIDKCYQIIPENDNWIGLKI